MKINVIICALYMAVSLTACGSPSIRHGKILEQLNDPAKDFIASMDVLKSVYINTKASNIPSYQTSAIFGGDQPLRTIPTTKNQWIVAHHDCSSVDLENIPQEIIRTLTHENFQHVSGNYNLRGKFCLVEFVDDKYPKKLNMRLDDGGSLVDSGHYNFVITLARFKFTEIIDITDFGGEGCEKRAEVLAEPIWDYRVETKAESPHSKKALACLIKSEQNGWVVNSVKSID